MKEVADVTCEGEYIVENILKRRKNATWKIGVAPPDTCTRYPPRGKIRNQRIYLKLIIIAINLLDANRSTARGRERADPDGDDGLLLG